MMKENFIMSLTNGNVKEYDSGHKRKEERMMEN